MLFRSLKQGTEGTADENYVLPDSLKNSTCDQHKSWWDRWFGNGEEPENGEENTPSADEKPVEKPDEPAPEPEEDQTQQPPEEDADAQEPEDSSENHAGFFDQILDNIGIKQNTP